MRTLQNGVWIPVSERLPEIGRSVILAHQNGLTFAGTLCEGMDDTLFWEWGNNACPLECVTHWMPMPAAPVVKPYVDPLALDPSNPNDCVANGTRFCEVGCKKSDVCGEHHGPDDENGDAP